MSKKDYKDTNIRNRYKDLVEDPESDLVKVTVSSDEKRTRAELLDMIETLFVEDDMFVFNRSLVEKLRAMLHILIKSVDNSLDDSTASAVAVNTAKTGITTSQANAIVANTAKTGITTSQANAITANTAKTGISDSQASAITANTAKVSFPVSAEEGNSLSFTVEKSTLTIANAYTDPETDKTTSYSIKLKLK
tara:strand:+ start:499 stop:1077 length:579 start_codon:yes stop_codon:yes gene_type:complete